MESSTQSHLAPKPPKAIALMSGGLDSTLAARLIRDQGVEVIGLHLLSPFGCREDVERSARSAGISLIVKEKGPSYLDLVENPRYGYGRNMNPCVDCRIFMFELADVVRQDLEADFIITGEVIGQRPMSQQRKAMELIERMSKMERLILRPLSAHSFPPTIAEEKGWVDRVALYRMSGRGRSEQIALARELGIEEYASPAGGCLLTEAPFSARLKDFFRHVHYRTPEQRAAQAEILRVGRHFRLSKDCKVILGRNVNENQLIGEFWPKTGGDFYRPLNFEGPSALVLGSLAPADEADIGQLVAAFSKRPEEGHWTLGKWQFVSENPEQTLTVKCSMDEERREFLKI